MSGFHSVHRQNRRWASFWTISLVALLGIVISGGAINSAQGWEPVSDVVELETCKVFVFHVSKPRKGLVVKGGVSEDWMGYREESGVVRPRADSSGDRLIAVSLALVATGEREMQSNWNVVRPRRIGRNAKLIFDDGTAIDVMFTVGLDKMLSGVPELSKYNSGKIVWEPDAIYLNKSGEVKHRNNLKSKTPGLGTVALVFEVKKDEWKQRKPIALHMSGKVLTLRFD